MMASGVVVKTKRKGKFADNAVRYNEMSLRQNGAILDYCRTSMSSLSGAAAGILGLTGVQGFAFYFVTAFLLSVMLMFKAGGSWNKYFVTRRDLFISGLFGGIFTYILFWTIFIWNGACVLTFIGKRFKYSQKHH